MYDKRKVQVALRCNFNLIRLVTLITLIMHNRLRPDTRIQTKSDTRELPALHFRHVPCWRL